ncbi:IS1182 family transposase [Miniphocaeibacter halophilus]|uniref:IS1182 family transposase n=1 Tax=Miniphocaeibacter halophilus TaxID=2931922 RepID=A0AC61MPA1_9FIRM|nr:IS1182 family transposase [Miniphocaeibacter halophilus]QQK07342.1 IS1182 family transposase [Miniphocaeibacter halophilus]
MMGKKDKISKTQIEILSLDSLVPQDHLVRKLDQVIDLSFIYDLVKDLYSKTGAESIDPVVLIKLNIIQYTFGIRSMRQTIKEIEVNAAYRWYLGYGLTEKIPHFSTFSKNYQRRFKGTDIFEQIFFRILNEIAKCGLLTEENIYIDGTHIKANANIHNKETIEVEESVKYYQDILEKEINEDRKNHNKKPLKKNEEIKTKEITVSKNDPDCGIFHKGEHKKVFAYLSNTACNDYGIILDFEVTSGNKHDSTVFPILYERIKNKYKSNKYIAIDAGYKTPAIAKQILDNDKIPLLPYKRPMTKKGFYKKYEYVYDEYYDCYICPNNKILKYSTTNRNGYQEYKSNPNDCKNCKYVKNCTESKNNQKVVTRHIWEEYIEKCEDIRHTKGFKEKYGRRKETIERVFADAKELHGMRYTLHRGLERVKNELYLLFGCMNLKKLAKIIWKRYKNSSELHVLFEDLKNISNFRILKRHFRLLINSKMPFVFNLSSLQYVVNF